jgi:hypothetical protein
MLLVMVTMAAMVDHTRQAGQAAVAVRAVQVLRRMLVLRQAVQV